MADNVTLNSGSGGAVLATDDVVGVQYQRVKLTDGTADSSTVIAAGNGTSATALRVTVSSDSTGVLSVDDNGGSLTVDGTVTANLSATDNAVLDSIDAAVNGTVAVSAVSLPLPSGAATAANQTTIAGHVDGIEALLTTIDSDTSAIIGTIHSHDTAVGSTVQLVGAYATNSVEGMTQVGAGDATRLTADLNGCIVTRPHTTLEEIISERISDTAGTSTNFTNFAAGGAGVHNYVTTISVMNTSATDGYVDIRDGSAGSVLFTVPAPAGGGSVINLPVPLKGAANTALAYDVSGALSTVYLSVVGFQAQG